MGLTDMPFIKTRGNGSGAMAQIKIFERQAGSVFICYAHEDNISANLKERWLDRFQQFVTPLVRQENLKIWSDKEVKIGENWHNKIQNQLMFAKAVVLFVSPAFLASDYIANNELPILLKRANESGVPIYQFIISPCMHAETVFKYPDPVLGPKEFTLSMLQAANPPSRTLIEMSEAEQNRVMLEVARSLKDALNGNIQLNESIQLL